MKLIHCIVAVCLALAGFVKAQAEVRLAAGQSFALRLAGVPSEETLSVSATYTISSGGKVKLPYLSAEVDAAGLSPTELQRKIENAYKTAEIYTHPTITVMVNTQMAVEAVITVGGEVRQPNDVPFRPGINLYSAIMRCGGPTEFADMKRVKLIRNGGKVEKIYDLRKVTPENNPDLQAGDQIAVPQD